MSNYKCECGDDIEFNNVSCWCGEIMDFGTMSLDMTLNDYQSAALKTWTVPNGGVTYLALGLAGEAGEVANKFKKILRGDLSEAEAREAIADELGDVLWYLSVMAQELGYTLEEVAKINAKKLQARAANGTIRGEGDKR